MVSLKLNSFGFSLLAKVSWRMLNCSNFALTNSEMDCDHNYKLTSYLLSNQKFKKFWKNKHFFSS